MDPYNFFRPPPPPPIIGQLPTLPNSNEGVPAMYPNAILNPSTVTKSKDPRIANNSDAWKEHVASQYVAGNTMHNPNLLANGSNGNYYYEPQDSINQQYTQPAKGEGNNVNRKRPLAQNEYSNEPTNKRNWQMGNAPNVEVYTDYPAGSTDVPTWNNPPEPPNQQPVYKNAYDAALLANLQSSLNLPPVSQAPPPYQYEPGYQGAHGYYQQPSNVIYTNNTQIYTGGAFPIPQDSLYPTNQPPPSTTTARSSAPNNRKSTDRNSGWKQQNNKHRTSGSRWSSSGNRNGTDTRNPPPKTNPGHESTEERSKSAKKRKKRSIPESVPTRPWNKQDATRALNIETFYRNAKSTKQIMLRFPDQDLNPEIVKKFHTGIKSVHFQAPSSARYCFVQLEDEVDLNQVISDLNTIPFQNGFLRAEQKTQKDEEKITPEGIDPYTLYLGNLPHNVTSTTVKDQFPNSTRVDIGFAQKIKYTRYAFIRFSNVDDAIAAFERSVNMIIDNRSVVIRFRRGKGTINPPGTVCKEETMMVAARQRDSRREQQELNEIIMQEEDIYPDEFYNDISDDDDDTYYEHGHHGDIPDDNDEEGGGTYERRIRMNYDGEDKAKRSSQFKDFEYYLSEQYGTNDTHKGAAAAAMSMLPVKLEKIKKEMKSEKLKKEERVGTALDEVGEGNKNNEQGDSVPGSTESSSNVDEVEICSEKTSEAIYPMVKIKKEEKEDATEGKKVEDNSAPNDKTTEVSEPEKENSNSETVKEDGLRSEIKKEPDEESKDENEGEKAEDGSSPKDITGEVSEPEKEITNSEAVKEDELRMEIKKEPVEEEPKDGNELRTDVRDSEVRNDEDENSQSNMFSNNFSIITHQRLDKTLEAKDVGREDTNQNERTLELYEPLYDEEDDTSTNSVEIEENTDEVKNTPRSTVARRVYTGYIPFKVPVRTYLRKIPSKTSVNAQSELPGNALGPSLYEDEFEGDNFAQPIAKTDDASADQDCSDDGED